MVKISPSNAGDVGLIPGRRTKIQHWSKPRCSQDDGSIPGLRRLHLDGDKKKEAPSNKSSEVMLETLGEAKDVIKADNVRKKKGNEKLY